MQCSITVERDRASGNKMKTNSYKNPYRKESNLDNIVDQLCTRLQDIKDQESPRVGMPTVTLEHSEAVRRYYAAFPALKKGQESPPQYYLPPPAWCRPQTRNMQSEVARDWSKKKERRNSCHGQKKSKKRCTGHRSFGKESLPEWVTSEGVWDMDTQDPVKEFIRAIALDEGYGTCENTVVDEMKDAAGAATSDYVVPDWDDCLDLAPEWAERPPRARSPLDEELYARFEAKFDRSLEALWAPDDEYQDLPIDFTDLLSSPSDRLFDAPPSARAESIWASGADGLHDRFKPLNLGDPPAPAPPPPADLHAFLYEGEDVYAALSSVADTMRSFSALNHSRERSGFAEVPPRRARAAAPPPPAPAPPARPADPPRKEDLLTSARTHFRPIRRELERETRYKDGDTFDIRGDLEPVSLRRSPAGGAYLGRERYLEYRADHTIDYTRLNLTAAQRCPDLEDPGFRLRFPVRQTDAGVQTDERACDGCGPAGGCSGCAAPRSAAAPDELSREWEELLADISAAHAQYRSADAVEDTLARADRKRRHSAALRGGPEGAPDCSHPHARFLHCCALAQDRPLTR